MANPHFLRALLGGLSEHLQTSHKETLKKNAEEEANDRSIFEAMTKTDNPELQQLGLAGLMEKRGRGWFGKLRQSKVMPEVQAILQRANYASDVVPRGLDAAPPAAPKPQAGAPPTSPAPTAQAPTSPTEGGEMTLTPGVSAPPEPGYSMTAPTSEDIQARMQPPPSPPSPPPSYRDSVESRRREFHSQNPLGQFRLSPMEERQLQAESLGLSPDEIRQRMTDELFPTSARASNAQSLEEIRQRGRMALLESKRGIELDAATAARLGVEAGTIDRDLFKELERNMRSADQIQARAANAQLIRQNYNLKFFPSVDGSGVMAVDPRRGQPVGEVSGVRFTAPSATEEAKITGMLGMKQDAEEVRGLIEGKANLIGAGRGVAENIKQWFNAGDPTWVKLNDLLNRMRTGQMYELTGKAAAAWEREGIGRMVPQLDTFASSPQRFYQQLDGYERKVDQFLNTYRSGSRAPGGPPPERPVMPPVGGRKIGDTKTITTGPYAGKTGTWNGLGWEVK